jgi:hypothetical protein
MASEIQRYLLKRELDLWHTEAERTQNRLDDLRPDSPEATKEKAWSDHCFHRHEQIAHEIHVQESMEE